MICSTEITAGGSWAISGKERVQPGRSRHRRPSQPACHTHPGLRFESGGGGGEKKNGFAPSSPGAGFAAATVAAARPIRWPGAGFADRSASPPRWHSDDLDSSPELCARCPQAREGWPDRIHGPLRHAMNDGIKNRGRCLSLKGLDSGGHLEEDDPEREQIRAGVQGLAQRLFRRHVGNGSQRRSAAIKVIRRPRAPRKCRR